MSDNPLKIIEIQGELLSNEEEGKFDFVIYSEYANIFEGVWQIAILDLTVLSNNSGAAPPNQKFLKISTNFVVGAFGKSFQREFVPIAKFQYSESGERLIRFNPPLFFNVNNQQRLFQLYLKTYGKNLQISNKLTFFITVGLRRVL